MKGKSDEYYTCSLNSALLTEYKNKEGKWRSFSEFVKLEYGVRRIHIKEGCTCSMYLKVNVCKHHLGMEIRLKMVDVPAEAKVIPLGQKRKRGRPSKARKALIIQ